MKKCISLVALVCMLLISIFSLSSCGACAECDGTGYIVCPICEGNILEYDPIVDAYVACQNCSTLGGKIKCPNCFNWIDKELEKIPYDMGVAK